MRRISSKWTWWWKSVFPALWYGFLIFATVASLIGAKAPGNQANPPIPLLLAIFVGMGVFGYVLTRWLIFPLMDEVYLADDHLLVRNRGEEDTIPLDNVVNVEGSVMMSPERITLTLREPSRFGREIIFCPPFRWWTLTRHPLADELMRLVHKLPSP